MKTSLKQQRTRRSGQMVAVLACSLLVLTACSTEGPDQPDEITVTDGPSGLGETPEFTGPWAAEFTAEYQRAGSDFERAVLVDGVITDQELAETRDKFTQCLTAFGFTNVSFEDGGAYSLDAPDGADSETVNDQTKECSIESGEASIGALHSAIRRNPQNQNEHTIMAACLVRKGVVDPSYSAKDYAEDLPDDNFPYIDGASGAVAFQECNADPLGLYE